MCEKDAAGLVIIRGILDMQVCVPEEWTDEQVLSFAEKRNPCGTTTGWAVRREGSERLNGDPERARCDLYSDRVHIMLDA